MGFFAKGLLFSNILETLRQNRFCHVESSLPEPVFNAINYDLGQVIRKEDVYLNSTTRLVHQAKALRFHTDQPYVDIIAWQCLEPDPRGPTVLLDADKILRLFDPEKLKILLRAVAMYPNPDNLSEACPERVIRIEEGYLKLYFITFRGAKGMIPEVQKVWEEFVEFVETEGPKHAFEVTLKKGECLFLHNKSFFHARPALDPKTQRRLRRVWIRSSLVKGLRADAYPALAETDLDDIALPFTAREPSHDTHPL